MQLPHLGGVQTQRGCSPLIVCTQVASKIGGVIRVERDAQCAVHKLCQLLLELSIVHFELEVRQRADCEWDLCRWPEANVVVVMMMARCRGSR